MIQKILDKLEFVKKSMFLDKEMMLQEEEVRNRADYEKLMEEYSEYRRFDALINSVGYEAPDHHFVYKGYCAVCGRDTCMHYSGVPADKTNENGNTHFLREHFVCLECGCNARLRFMIQKMRKEYNRGMKVYAYERVTATYREIAKFIPKDDLIGSEYFGNQYVSGEYVDGVLHEDAANLSFGDDSFDLMLSMDVFEHTYYYENVYREVYRVLKPGGKLLLTIPMRPIYDETVERAKIVDGEIVHMMEPIYHGDPLQPQNGVLEFIQYGWDIIPFLKKIGFREVKMKTYYSINDAYLGCIPFYFELIK